MNLLYRFSLSLIFTLYITEISAQGNTKPIKLRGIVKDASTQQSLVGAHILVGEQKLVTDNYGKFIFFSPNKTETITVSYLGYESQTRLWNPEESKNEERLFLLTPKKLTLQEAVVKAERISNFDIPGQVIVRRELISRTSGLLENPINMITTMPGVSRSNDLFNPSPIYIRGGSPDENLFLLDNVIMFWPWYFGGQQSVYNTEVIEQVELLTGGFPASYGNYLSSVMNVTTRQGSYDQLKGNASIGFLYSHAAVETPIIANKLSLLLAGRSTYLDKIFPKAPFPNPSLLDGNFKLSYRINDNNTISFSGLSSKEKLNYQSKDANDNSGLTKIDDLAYTHTQSLSWQSRFRQKWYSKLFLTHSKLSNEFTLETDDSRKIRAENWGVREDISYFIAKDKQFKIGIEAYKTDFASTGYTKLGTDYSDPNRPEQSTQLNFNINNQDTYRWGSYALYEGKFYGRWSGNVGLRYDYRKGTANLSPRIRLNYALAKNTTVHTAYGYYYQFAGDDVISSAPVPSNLAIHYTFGISQRFSPTISGWIEAYYKDYTKLLVQQLDLSYSDEGKGSSKGIELLLQKTQGKLQGWLSYAWAHSQRTYGLDNKIYDFSYDQRHILNTVLELKTGLAETAFWRHVLGDFIQLRYRFETGKPYTPVLYAVNFNNTWYPVRGAINSERLPNYSNLNVRVEWRGAFSDFKGRIHWTYYAECWNVLNQQNVYQYQYKISADKGTVIRNTIPSMTIMPGFGFKISF